MKNAILTFLLLVTAVTCFSQTSYKNLSPGKSTRADVERMFGQPVQSVSKTLAEYKSQRLTRSSGQVRAQQSERLSLNVR